MKATEDENKMLNDHVTRLKDELKERVFLLESKVTYLYLIGRNYIFSYSKCRVKITTKPYEPLESTYSCLKIWYQFSRILSLHEMSMPKLVPIRYNLLKLLHIP